MTFGGKWRLFPALVGAHGAARKGIALRDASAEIMLTAMIGAHGLQLAHIGGDVKMVILAITAWVLTGVIATLGLSAGSTIWFYMEPVVDTVPDPASYYVASAAGFLALFLSLVMSVGVTVHAARCNASGKA